MENKSFTKKLVSFLIENDMPSAQGSEAKESGLVILLSINTSPVCASYGSGEEMTKAIYNVISQYSSVRSVILGAVVAYAKLHPESTDTKKLIELLELPI